MQTPIKHTGGKWYVAPNGHCVFTDAQEAVGKGIAMCGMAARTPEEAKANAHLISAAPDLLEACLQLIKCVEYLIPEKSAVPVADVVLFQVRAAIAKAISVQGGPQ